jgi:hypothetical protein
MLMKSLPFMPILLLAGCGSATIPPSQVAALPSVSVDTSALRPGMECRIGVAKPTQGNASISQEYAGTIAAVSEQEIVLDNVVVTERRETVSPIISWMPFLPCKNVGIAQQTLPSVHIPLKDITWLYNTGTPATSDGGDVERIGIDFK